MSVTDLGITLRVIYMLLWLMIHSKLSHEFQIMFYMLKISGVTFIARLRVLETKIYTKILRKFVGTIYN